MSKVWRVISFISLAALVLGGLSFGLSLMVGADLVRIADVVFARYDLVEFIKAWDSLAANIGTLLGSIF